jgi:hypothetical protein
MAPPLVHRIPRNKKGFRTATPYRYSRNPSKKQDWCFHFTRTRFFKASLGNLWKVTNYEHFRFLFNNPTEYNTSSVSNFFCRTLILDSFSFFTWSYKRDVTFNLIFKIKFLQPAQLSWMLDLLKVSRKFQNFEASFLPVFGIRNLDHLNFLDQTHIRNRQDPILNRCYLRM